MTSSLYRIVAPYFVAGFIEKDGIVIEVAPIIAWLRGKTTTYVTAYCANHAWLITPVGKDETSDSKSIKTDHRRRGSNMLAKRRKTGKRILRDY